MNATLHNVSSMPLEITGIGLAGPGVGSVVRVTERRLVPLDGPDREITPAGIYRVYPPALAIGGACHVARMVAVDGYVLDPDEAVRALFLVRAADTGPFSWDAVRVTYRAGGDTFQETVDQGERGTVVATGEEHPLPTRDELRCARDGGAEILSSHAG